MHKNPEVKIINEEEKPRKSKRNRKVTACSDKRRSPFNCGICGSENIVSQGVTSCRFCNFEHTYIEPGGLLWFERSRTPDHICFDGKSSRFSLRSIGVKKCIDCGAVKGPICPACGYPCWSKDFKKFCKRCSFVS